MKVKKGDTVKMEYTGKLENGTTFDQSKAGEPVEFVVGAGRVIPGIERAVEGMDVGENKTVNVPATEAYGERDEDLLRRVERTSLPAGFAPEVGMVLTLELQSGEAVAATVAGITDKDVLLDLNHPLSGKNLVFDIKVVEAEPPKVKV